MKKLPKTIKVKGYEYKLPNRGMRIFSFNADDCFRMVEHKGQPRIVTCTSRTKTNFRSCQLIGPSRAKALIAWLAGYVVMCDKQNPAGFLFTDSHARLNAAKRNLDELARFFAEDSK